jgi:hypothetical protein
LSLGSAGIIWIFSLKKYWRDKKKAVFIGSTLASVLIFVISLSPLILFDFRHDFLNLRAFYDLIFGKEDQIRGASQLVRILKETHGRSMQILFEVVTNQLRWLNTLLVMAVFAFLVKILAMSKRSKFYSGNLVVIIWLAIGVVGTSVYQSSVFDHYISFLFPVSALVLGMVLSELTEIKLGGVLSFMFVAWYLFANLQRYRYQTVTWGIDQIQELSQKIVDTVTASEKYNVVLLADHGDIDAMNYRYFLTVSSRPPLIKERFGESDTLFIINEDKKLKKVVDSPIYEIVVFPNKNSNEVWAIPDGPEVTVLRR